jgi:hypothetical protein
LDQIEEHIPGSKKVFILRHPFAVAESKKRVGDLGIYNWSYKPSDFLDSDPEINNLLDDKRPLIKDIETEADSWILKVTVWCILHSLAFRSKSIKNYQVVFYEHLVVDPAKTIKDLFNNLGFNERYKINESKIEALFKKPSFSSNDQNTIKSSREGRSVWQEAWPQERIERGLDILKAFDLDFIYGSDHFPKLTSEGLQSHFQRNQLFLERITN